MNRMFIHWTGPAPGPMGRFKPIIGLLMLDLWLHIKTLDHTTLASKLQKPPPPPLKPHARPRHRRASTGRPPSAACYVIGLVSITATRIFRPCQNPSDLLVQIDGGILIPVVDLIDDLPPPTF
ncbi:hypothetical protein F511_46348 [Dorcoceras hygrometricum]|uniref:Uncharacterized protein n=1 Tax=Dorcoceras hygrometricum TaxID=472368 RepID=A0A2Z6ZTS1_9LAMI|nr:hypothetical protein F511_46348 [Dorcoceras hygrometricum]